MKRAAALLLISALLTTIGAIDMAPAENITPTQLAGSYNRFGFAVFSKLAGTAPRDNIFISPYSIASALTMTYGGASGTTALGMSKTLQLPKGGRDDIYAAGAGLMQEVQSGDSLLRIDVANSLWKRQGIPFKPEFIESTRNSFGATVSELDFNSPRSVDEINGWVRANTRDKIQKIIDRINPDLVLYLINAVYFKGTWMRKFDATLTREQDFFLLNGRKMKASLMRQKDEFQHLRGRGFQAVRLPYAGDRTALYVFLPDKRAGLRAFLKQWNHTAWLKWKDQFDNCKGEVALPRFKLEYERELSQPLKSLGMAAAFGPGADFSGMSTAPLAISEVRHKTFVEVNEEGTEAAAVTSVGMRLLAMRPSAEFSFVADHPFVMAIADDRTGTILFMGAIVDPK